ncbi:MAG: Mov34/MPN/PAD-1 family protein [Halobacteriaceae archaeon]
MGLFGPRRVVGIAGDALAFAREASEDSHPDEYMGVLRGTPVSTLDVDADSGYVVTDVLVIPATKSSPTQATLQSNLVPNDSRTLGSVHSHPNGVLRPSDQDVASFGNGVVHVIVGAPYGPEDWAAFDRDGEPRDLPVLDVDLQDPEDFFDFTQADLDRERRR